MVRRADTSDEDVNPQSTTQVKAETIPKTEKHKGKAHGAPDEMSRAHAQDEEMSPKGAKRARVNDAGDALARNQEDEIQGQEAEPPVPLVARVKTLPRDVDGYIPGSIVRIQLRNFVTYDFVEFCPGPYLNMIIGPNGTGKSSIACAICIGLNWPPRILGRATELPSYVKIGADEGHIEIELKSPSNEPNLVIKRSLSATAKTSSFTLNGRGATGHEITERVARLNVQVGNLCSFLPQDKVSSFAAMTPVELLRETENAAGDERLKTWHATLIDTGAQLKEVNEKIQGERATMLQLQERNENIERDVQRYRERKEIERKIAMLNVLIPVQHYREARDEWLALKGKQRASHARVSRLQARNQPAHALLAKLEEDAAELHGKRELVKKDLRSVLAKVEKKTQECEELESKADDAHTALANSKKEEKVRLNTIKNAEAQIASITEELAAKVKVEDESEVKAERKRIVDDFEASPWEAEKRTNDRRSAAAKERRRRNDNAEADGRHQLKALDSIEARKLGNLMQWNRDAGDAVHWLRANKDKFKMEVFEPPCLSVTVPDQNFAAAVENSFGPAQMRMFVCQCKEDYDLLNHLINDNPGLGRKARVPTWYRPGTENDLTPPPMTPDELAQRGFDGYAIDYVDCPEGLKWYLKRELNMHRTAISLRGIKDLQGAIDAVGRSGPNGRTPSTNFVERGTLHQVSRSKYGQRTLLSSATELPPARTFGGNTQVNPVEKERIDDILLRCKQEAVKIHDEEREVGLESTRLAKVKQEHNADLATFDQRLDAIRQQANWRTERERKRKSAEQTRANALKKGNVAEVDARLRAQIMNIGKKRVKLVTEAVELAREVITKQTNATTLGLQYLQICAKKTALKELCDRKDAKYQLALAEFNKIDAAFIESKKTTKALMQTSQDMLKELQEELREEYQEQEQARTAYETIVKESQKNGQEPPPPAENVDLRSMEELQMELEKQEANLEMNTNTNPGVVEQYEKRKRDIEVLQKTIEGRERQAAKIEKNIKNARDNWEPNLRALVASIGQKFSAAFDRIGCAGEIRVREDESYAQWAIDILVKFRDTEKLQLLTSQRQSGGERSLTTILYLMSLTEQARAPFSLVDEINQGMDQRAERMVHNSMVEVTCKPDSAQYFLITPKLLPDLEYHERMKILCVNNGEWLPDEPGLGNMMHMIDAFVAKNKRA
ncbi:structural maintenance of chromosomes protein 5 [Favolaschia claudopus]|uniref:Structural maintenance of chromosomes protein 5 n=1 Tax=Favolaschia claudopus TaxID=2862362 RepID=A0AAW0BCP7_9AGAR